MYDLMKGLSEMGVDCDMMCACADGGGTRVIRQNGHAELICCRTLCTLASTTISPSLLSTLRSRCGDYDIIHVHHPDPMACLALRRSGYRGRVVLHWHSDILRQRILGMLYRPLQSWLIDRADVIIGGRQAIDGDTAQVGPQVAQKLGLSQVTYAEEILKCEDGKLTIRRHIDGGVETVEAPMPIVITVNGSAAPCRPCNAKLVMKYKHATVPLERTADMPYADLYETRPYLTLNQWAVADIDGDPQQCGLAGSPTKVKTVKNIVFQAKESKTLTGSDADIEGMIKELLEEKIIG